MACSDITITHHVVDQLPYGAAVAVRDEEGTIDVYLARSASLDRIAKDLSTTLTGLARAAYELDAAAAFAAVALPLTGVAVWVAHFASIVGNGPGTLGA